MLDNISGGRLILGLGRGAGKIEFDGFRLSMDESRDRFIECAEMVLGGLESGHCEYDGRFVKQPRAAIRPAPFKSFRGRTYAAAVSPESLLVEKGLVSHEAIDRVIDFFMNLQVWGTPAQCYEKILDVRRRVGNETFVGVFSYAGMPWDDAERNIRLFAREVLPLLQRLPAGEQGTDFASATAARRADAPVMGQQLEISLLGS